MKAVFITEFGGADNLEIREVDEPSRPTGSEVLVRVRAAALNRADLLQRRGLYPAPKGYPERIPGLEFAGEVIAVGDATGRWKTGDRVCGITAGGAQAELLLTDESLLARVPPTLTDVQAGAIPEAFITAHDAVFSQAQLSDGETLLVHAVGSGVGLAALQLAKARGNRVFGTSRTPAKLGRCKEFGLDEGFVTANDADFASMIRERGGADVVLELVGAKFLAGNLDALNPRGRLMLVGTTGGARAELDLLKVMSKRLRILGTVLRSRSLEEKAAATKLFADEVLPLFVSGEIKPTVERVFPADDVRQAHELLESNTTFGKLVLEF